MKKRNIISVIALVFNESQVIEAFYHRLKQALSSLESFDHEIILVDDGSRDDSYHITVRLPNSDPHVKLVKFS